MESSIQEEIERTLHTLPPELWPAIRGVPFVKTISDIGAYYRLTTAELNALAKESARFVAREHSSQSFIQTMVQALGNDRMKTAAVLRKVRVALLIPLIQQMKIVLTSPPPEPQQPRAVPGAVPPAQPVPPPRPLPPPPPPPSPAAMPRAAPVPQPRPPVPPPPIPRPPPMPPPVVSQIEPPPPRFSTPLPPPPIPAAPWPQPTPPPPPKPTPPPQEPQPPQPLIIYPLTKTPIPLPSRPPQSPTPLEPEREGMLAGTLPAPTIGPSGIRPSSPEPYSPSERPLAPTPPSPYVIRKEELQRGNAGSAIAPPPNLPTTGQEPPPPPAPEHSAPDPYRESIE